MHARRAGAGRRSRGGLHRPRTVGERGRAAAHHGAQHRGQGRRIAGTPARRDRAVPASRVQPICRPRSSACWSGSTLPTRIWSAAPCCWWTTIRATSSRCRACWNAAACRCLTATTGQRGDRAGRTDPGTRHRADGHHDAGNGRLSDHREDPRQSGLPPAADHRADRQGDEGRPREMPGSRARRTISPSRSTPNSYCRRCACGSIARPDLMARQSQRPAGRRSAGEASRQRGDSSRARRKL